MLNSSSWFLNNPTFYNDVATQSARFDDGSSAYLTKTFGSDGTGSGATCTVSCWVKRTTISNSDQWFFTAGSSSPAWILGFRTNDNLAFGDDDANPFVTVTNRVFRDTSAWYHIVLRVKTSESANADKYKIYVNGELQATTFSGTAADTLLGANVVHNIGRYPTGSSYFDGYMAEVNFIDGQALDPTSFGEFKNGVWIPKKYTGSYGTNGFRLQFNQTGTGTASSSTIGADTSGNANHFTSSGIVASDCDMPDSPENNFATLNSLQKGYASTPFSEGNLKVVGTGSAGAATYSTVASTMELTGKVYFEVYINALTGTGRTSVGIVGENYLMDKYGSISTVGVSGFDQAGDLAGVGTGDDDWNTAKGGNASTETYTGGGSDTVADVGDIVQIAYDSDTGYAWYGVIDRDSGDTQSWFNSGNPANGTGYVGILDTAVKQFAAGIVQSSSDSLIFNFGQDSSFAGLVTAQGNTDNNNVGDFYGTVPSGFVASCSVNLPEPTISPNADTQADDYFNTVTYTGNGTGQSITVGFQPDWTWIKRRSAAERHWLTDSVRGVTKGLFSSHPDAEVTRTDQIQSFDTDGFTLGNDGAGYSNIGGNTYVAWNWKTNGGTIATNTNGTITSSVSANTDAGFSIVAYQGNDASSATVGHGLSQAPEMVIVKNRQEAITNPAWAVYHAFNTSAPETDYLDLSTTAATGDANTVWNDTAPTSTVVTIGTADSVNSGSTHIMYCFHSVEGYSKFGSYTGNGNADGTFIYTGFRPAWVMMKNTVTAGNSWVIQDAVRSTYNVVNAYLLANDSGAEGTGVPLDILSNGFKMKSASQNDSGANFIYMAFAENPFKYSTAR